jgi:effector-binding domain-containing protein
MKYQCRLIDDNDTRQVLAIRRTTTTEKLPETLSDCYSKIRAYLDKMGESPVGSPFVSFYNNDQENLEVDAGYYVAKHVKGKGEIVSRVTNAGKKISCIYIGKHEKTEVSYDEITDWIKERNYETKGAAYIFYHDDPTEIPEGMLGTEVVISVE